MIQELSQVALLVRDYEEAKHFYCDKLGFEVIEDTLLSPNKKWVRLITSSGRGSALLLSKAVGREQLDAVGAQAAGRVFLYLRTDNLDADYSLFKERGVEFREPPRIESYGKVAVMKDLYGNRIDLIEPYQPR